MKQEITLRPHHIARFVDYYLSGTFNKESLLSYGYDKNTVDWLNSFYDELASQKNPSLQITVSEGGLDYICENCTSDKMKRESCKDLDNLSLWNGSGIIMERTGFVIGKTYNVSDFLKRIDEAYSSHKPALKQLNSFSMEKK